VTTMTWLPLPWTSTNRHAKSAHQARTTDLGIVAHAALTLMVGNEARGFGMGRFNLSSPSR